MIIFLALTTKQNRLDIWKVRLRYYWKNSSVLLQDIVRWKIPPISNASDWIEDDGGEVLSKTSFTAFLYKNICIQIK